ncbi:hypothetical protein V8C26DRAFT_26952 [Trichoderma gracile]
MFCALLNHCYQAAGCIRRSSITTPGKRKSKRNTSRPDSSHDIHPSYHVMSYHTRIMLFCFSRPAFLIDTFRRQSAPASRPQGDTVPLQHRGYYSQGARQDAHDDDDIRTYIQVTCIFLPYSRLPEATTQTAHPPKRPKHPKHISPSFPRRSKFTTSPQPVCTRRQPNNFSSRLSNPPLRHPALNIPSHPIPSTEPRQHS